METVTLNRTHSTSYAVSTVAGLVFTGSITPQRPDSGALVTGVEDEPDARAALTGELFLDGPLYVTTAQAWREYKTLREILASQGTDLSQLVRQRIFVRDLSDIPAVERVMGHFLRDLPATVIVAVAGKGVDPRIRVSMDFVAAVPGATDDPIERIHLPEAQTGKYPAAVRAAGLVFTSALQGVNGDGRVAEQRADVEDLAPSLATYPVRTERQEAVLAQAWLSLRNMGRALELAGTSLSNTLRINGWVTIDIRDYDPIRAVRGHFFPAIEDKTASIGLTMRGLSGRGNLAMFDGIAAVPAAGVHKAVSLPPSDLASYFVGAVRGGPFVITCGEVPIDFTADTPRVVRAVEDGRGDSESELFGRVDGASVTEVQAAHVYGTLESYLQAYGSSLGRTVHQTIYLVDTADYPAVAAISKYYFRNHRMPPTTIIPIRETSPFRHKIRLEIDLIAI